jgi:hypothetical protein
MYTMKRVSRIVVYLWVLPASLVGLLLALPMWLTGARLRWVDGVLEIAAGAHGCWYLPKRVAAITFGHVVLGRCLQTLAHWRRHEHAHVRQYERWGVLFFPLYLGESVRVWLRGGQPYRDNCFERAARLAERD